MRIHTYKFTDDEAYWLHVLVKNGARVVRDDGLCDAQDVEAIDSVFEKVCV